MLLRINRLCLHLQRTEPHLDQHLLQRLQLHVIQRHLSIKVDHQPECHALAVHLFLQEIVGHLLHPLISIPLPAKLQVELLTRRRRELQIELQLDAEIGLA